MIFLFDYLLAFVVLGLGGLFRHDKLSQGASLSFAAVTTGVLRYLCHVVSGCTVWAGLSVPTPQAVLYSLSYNASYMIPEIIILVLGAVYLSRLLSLSGNRVSRVSAVGNTPPRIAVLFSAIAKTALLVTVVVMVCHVFPALQWEDGTLFLQGLKNVPWATVGLIGLIGSWVFLLLEYLCARITLKKTV
jgi:thiamine transporter